MFMHVTQARYVADYRLWLAFNDGAAGEVDLAPELDGELFEPLRDLALFRSFRLEGHTVAWDNGADFAPEFLRGRLVEQTVGSAVRTSDLAVSAVAGIMTKARSQHGVGPTC